jgi:hypothetical protein
MTGLFVDITKTSTSADLNSTQLFFLQNVTVLEDVVVEIADIFNKKNSQRFIETDTALHFRIETNKGKSKGFP